MINAYIMGKDFLVHTTETKLRGIEYDRHRYSAYKTGYEQAPKV